MNVDLEITNGDHDGPLLYAVNFVDEDDTEDSTVEIYRAKDEEDLYEQVRYGCIGDTEDDLDEDLKSGHKRFEEEWGISILFTEIGLIKF